MKYKIRKEALEEAAKICEKMVVGGRQWTTEQEIAANALLAAADNILKLIRKEEMKIKAFVPNNLFEWRKCVTCSNDAKVRFLLNAGFEIYLCNGCARELGEKLIDAAKRRPKNKVKL